MAVSNKKKALRMLDANYNRSKEGLRVLEDIFRFLKNNRRLTRRLRHIRHNLDNAVNKDLFIEALSMRNAASDIGKNIDNLDLRKKNLLGLVISNFQRVKESLRVMEETAKITGLDPRVFKNARYKVYELEKDAFSEEAGLFNSRRKYRSQE